jgi:hypothetical protein
MNEFILVFRRDYKTKELQPSDEEMQIHLKHWQDWFRSLAAQDILARPVQRLDTRGKLVKHDRSVTDGPYMEIKESIGGLIIIKAEDYQAAIKIAEGCPVLELGGNVEVRLGN